jgi:hypothetical protein
MTIHDVMRTEIKVGRKRYFLLLLVLKLIFVINRKWAESFMFTHFLIKVLVVGLPEKKKRNSNIRLGSNLKKMERMSRSDQIVGQLWPVTAHFISWTGGPVDRWRGGRGTWREEISQISKGKKYLLSLWLWVYVSVSVSVCWALSCWPDPPICKLQCTLLLFIHIHLIYVGDLHLYTCTPYTPIHLYT